MHTHTVHLNVPDAAGLNDEALQEYLAAKLYADGKLSLGQAAELLGKSKWDMPRILSKYCVPYFNYSVEDYEKETHFPLPSTWEQSFRTPAVLLLSL